MADRRLVWSLKEGWAIPWDEADALHRNVELAEDAVLTYEGKEYVQHHEPCGVGSKSIAEAVHGADFMWTEGNYSCDCNRALFVARAGGPIQERTFAEGWGTEPEIGCDDGVNKRIGLADLRCYLAVCDG